VAFTGCGRTIPRAVLLTLPGQFALAWAFSASSVLGYDLITNLCALRLPLRQRRFPPVVAWVGMVGCAGLAFRVDTVASITGLLLVPAGLLWVQLRRRRSPSSTS
jgi:APA family basic amino acid/polyamine antiporter